MANYSSVQPALVLGCVLMTLLHNMGCQSRSSPGADPRDDDSTGGTAANSTGGSTGAEDGDEGKTVCERFCAVAYRCPDGVPCADESCYDLDYCESNCEGQRTPAAERGCEEFVDLYYECASQQTDACEADDPTRAFNLPCSGELNEFFACYYESENP